MTIRTADPFTTDQEFAQGQPIMRRLFEVDYSCPLCGRNHIAETYVASITNNLDELNAEALRSMRTPETAIPLLQNHMRFVHTEHGNFESLLERFRNSTEEADLVVNSVTMTNEDTLSCDECAHHFDTLGDLWVHMGINPATGTRFAPAVCTATA